jgi:hypothetical protein
MTTHAPTSSPEYTSEGVQSFFRFRLLRNNARLHDINAALWPLKLGEEGATRQAMEVKGPGGVGEIKEL